MNLVLPGWRATFHADGLALYAPQGRAHGGIRIRDRQRPLRAVRDLVRAAVMELKLDACELAPIEPLTTAEGEYAAMTTIAGMARGARLERSVAFVFGDDFYTQIDGAAEDPAHHTFVRTAVRELAFGYALGLGEVRRRRYLYQPPIGWSGYPRGLITEWQPPGFPNDAASIAMFPARPVGESQAGALHRALHELGWAGFTRTDDGAATPLRTRHLEGARWRIVGCYGEGPVHHQDLVVLQDDRFHYVARLESTPARIEADRDVFDAVIETIEGLPRATATRGMTFDHWAD